ncbi:fumarylacetoacetate hydrolase family protein [Nesterenkonia muleiensis]|uniref:fumarylacetoacetate hydrolase family protein n=1 Tax=Nesterenkonia muleiensis TaxID=2282648 RepID=UPI000E744A8A|nr:fumarylacetoacetate hydrolase family protein [Nesterenkonia muleiensis]
MRLSTIRTPEGSAAARQEDGRWVVIDGYADVGELLTQDNWRQLAEAASGPYSKASDVELENPLPNPGKVICVGLNYASHIKEMGRDLPTHPTLFAKYAETLTGPFDPVTAVAEDPELDWEGELVVVIGSEAYRVTEEEAGSKIAGYSSANDISMRGWQFRTLEWLQGKIWAKSTPLGPVMVTADDFDYSASTLRTRVNGEVMQEHSIGDLVFTPEHLVSYISTMIPLHPGDVILTGTPGGVGRARDPQVFLKPGDVVEVDIEGIGPMRSEIVDP